MKRNILFLITGVMATLILWMLPEKLNCEDKTNPTVQKTSPGLLTGKSLNERVNDLFQVTNLRFLENKGQYPDSVKFHSKLKNADLFFLKDGIIFSAKIDDGNGSSKKSANSQPNKADLPDLSLSSRYQKFEMKLLGTNGNALFSGINPVRTQTNIFLGSDRTRWRSGIQNFERIKYENIYRGIDLTYYEESGSLKYDFIIKPNADINLIKFKYAGFNSIRSDSSGNLIIDYGFGSITEAAPKMYQEINGKKLTVSGWYVINSDSSISFKTENYDKSIALIIDPELSYSTYFGGSGDDKVINGFVISGSGDIIVSGMTNSTSFPSATGYDGTFNGAQDIFVCAFNNTLSQLKSVTYLGGAGSDGYTNIGSPIAIMPSGNIALTGYTASADFPITTNVFGTGTTYSGLGDAFVTILSPGLSAIVSSSYIGGAGADYGQTIAVDGGGNIYIGGTSTSTNFPHFSNSYQTTNKGGYDVTLTKFNSDLSSILASTYIGGTGTTELPWSMVYANDAIYLAGGTLSTDFPITDNAYDASQNGDRDCFIIKFNTSLSTLLASTYIGSPEYEQAVGMTADNQGNIYIIGDCRSGNYPTTSNAYDRTFAGPSDIFISKFDANLSSLVASTFIGGSLDDFARAIAVRENGEIVIGGGATSTDYPVSDNALYKTHNGSDDAVITFFSNNLSSRYFSSFLGGSGTDAIQYILFSGDKLYIAGNTTSGNFPTTTGAYDISANGLSDLFVSCINFGSETTSAPTIISPGDFIIGMYKNITFSWTSVSGSSGYRLQIATDSLFNSIVFDTITLATSKYKRLSPGNGYYWRVGSLLPTGAIAWSSKAHFTTGPLTEPVLQSPGNNSTNVNTSTFLTWEPLGISLYFNLQVSTDPLFETTIISDSLSTTARLIGPLNNNTKYYWRVRVASFWGISDWSDVWNFTTMASYLSVPVLSSPENNSIDLPTAFLLGWNAVNGATNYHLQISTDTMFSSTVLNDSSIISTNRISGLLLNNTKYFWRVRAKNSTSTSSWSLIRSFKTIAIKLGTSALLSPLNQSTNQPTTIKFIWNKVKDAEYYRFQLAEDSLFRALVRLDSIPGDSSTTVSSLRSGQKYFWRVLAESRFGSGDWSQTRSFITMGTILSPPTEPTPPNNSTNVANNPTLGWNSIYTNASFNFQLAYDSLFAQLIKDSTGISPKSIQLLNLRKGTKHYWRVNVLSGGVTSVWSEIWTFMTVEGISIIKDPNLELAIRDNLNKPEGEITPADMLSLVNLEADMKNISDLSGLEYAENLSSLSLLDNKITVLTPILNLAKLERLNLSNNELAVIPNLEKNVKLKYLNLDYNKLTAIDSLKAILSLGALSIAGNKIIDLSPISTLTGLDTLYADENDLVVTPSFTGLTSLKVLGLSNNKLINISTLSSLSGLKLLRLNNNLITDISPLLNLTQLENITLSANEIENADLPNLYRMDLLSNQGIKTDLNGEYVYGYLDLRYNSLISKSAVIALDNELPLIDYAHILWDSLDNNITLSGTVSKNGSPVNQVIINITGTQNKSTETNSSGFYSILVEKGGDYKITPSKAGYKFSPLSYSITDAYNDMVYDFSADNTPIIATGVEKIVFTAVRGGSAPSPQSFRIYNSGGGILEWSLTKDASWFNISPLQGLDSGIITVTVTNTNLLPIKHSGTITITDLKATNNPRNVIVELTIQSINLPVLQQTNSIIAESGSDKKIDFSLTNGDLPDRVTAYYRIGGASSYDSISATGQSGSYSFTIPNNKITGKGIDYFIKAYYNNTENIIQGSANTNFSIRVKIPEITLPKKLQRKTYSMFSTIDFDGTPLYGQLERNFGPANPKVWRAFKWRILRYDEILDNYWNIEKGDGFWLITNSDKEDITFQNLVSTPTGEPYKLRLSPGWNQIGNPFLFPVSLSNVSLPDDVENVFWKWDETIQNYQIENDKLDPWTGYLVKNNNLLPSDIVINPLSSQPETPKINLISGEWLINLKIISGSKELNYLKFGVLNGSSEDVDKNDAHRAPESPSTEPILNAYFKSVGNNEKELTYDFRQPGKEGQTWIVQFNNPEPGKEITIEFKTIGNLPPGYSAEFIYEGKKTALTSLLSNDKSRITIKQGADNFFVLKTGSDKYFEMNKDDYTTQIPGQFKLYQNYPNPFNPETNIEFYLPIESVVKLSVYNSLGSEIETLINKKLPSGVHTVKFSPAKLSSGLYFYRIDAGIFRDIKKMLYLR